MSAAKIKPPTIQQLVDIVNVYNTARAHELSQRPAGGWPADYKNPLMDNLYDAAAQAALALKMIILSCETVILEPRK